MISAWGSDRMVPMRQYRLCAIFLLTLIAGGLHARAAAYSGDTLNAGTPFTRVTDMLNLVGQKAMEGSVVRVAVVDDGFRLSHKLLRDFIFTNTQDQPGNFQDDDMNGFTDDVHGWDISDNDADVSVPRGRESYFYHGTYIAGVIAAMFQSFYGEDAKKYLQIIPVKVLSNHAQNKYLADGYKGIRYATEMGADIICCAWSGGNISAGDQAILDAAIAKGIMVIASAGNFYSEKAEAPSSYPGVFCVAALDSIFRKARFSNFGMRVDISAPGDSVYGPHPLADNAFICDDGTSPGTAIIAGCAAILKSVSPEAGAEEIFDALRNTAIPVDSMNLTFCGKLGAGIPDMSQAIEYIRDPEFKYRAFAPLRSEGKIWFRKNNRISSWKIRPAGAYKGIHLKSLSGEPKRKINLYAGDSIWYAGNIAGISKWTYIPGSRFTIEIPSGEKPPKELELSYYMETIDSTTLYCRDVLYLDGASGILTDGSGDENYANNCSCKWLITVPGNKRIRIVVTAIDTQPNVDYIWIFEGNATLQENLLAKFSGNGSPPSIISGTNQVLVWFSSDKTTTGKGWTLEYSSVE
jgi:serine protease